MSLASGRIFSVESGVMRREQSMGQVDPKRIGYLYVHGVGRQHRHSGTDESTLRRMGRRSLTPISEVHGDTAIEWDEVPEDRTVTDDLPFGTPAHAWVTVRHPNGSKGRILMAEAVWSDRVLQTKRWSQRFFNLRYLVYAIPAILFLLGPDRRDRHVLFEGLRGEYRRSFLEVLRDSWVNMFRWSEWELLNFRFGQRILVLMAFLAVILVMALNFPWSALSGLIIGMVALVVLLDPVQQVIIIVTQDDEREEALEYLEDRFKWLSSRCDEVVIVAHSQGAYLSHQLLLRRGVRNKVARFVAVGSGLKPLWVLRQLRDPWSMLVLWSLPISIILIFWGVSPLLFAWLISAVVMLGDLISIGSLLFGGTFLDVILGSPFVAVEDMSWVVLYDFNNFFLVFGDLTILNGVLIFLGVGVVKFSGFLMVRYVIPRIREGLVLPSSGGRGRPMEWQEFSSVHDAVGRWLMPGLPQGVEQDPIPVLGNPIFDHTGYFDSRGLWLRKMSGSILMDLERLTGRDFGSAVWNGVGERYMVVLREQHDSRRRFQSLVLFGVPILLFLSPFSVEFGLISNILAQLLIIVFLMAGFLSLGVWSHHQIARALDGELRGVVGPQALARVLSRRSRKVPALMLMAAGLAAFCGGSGVFAFATMYPQGPVPAPWGMVVGSIFLWVLAAAVQSGYPIKWWWPLAATVMTAIPVLTVGSPSAFGLPSWLVVPGVPAVLVVAFACLCAAVSLGRAVPSCLPTRSSELAV